MTVLSMTSPNTTQHVPDEADSGQASGRPQLRLAYLTPLYPRPSQTFIRREILELERRGHRVLRLAIRGVDDSVVDAADLREAEKTICCLEQPKWRLLWSLLATLFSRPRAFVRACRVAFGMSRVSDRGILRHGAYLVEAATLLPILQRERIQHVHVHFGTNAAAVARIMRYLGGPTYSMTVHGPGEFDGPRSLSLGAKVEDSLFTVAISSFGSSQLRRWVSHEQWDKLHVVRCSIGDDFLPSEQPIDPSSRTLTCVGRLTPQKGQLLLLDAFASLIRSNADARLVLAGDGELRDVVERRIDQLGLQEHVEITGWISEQEVRNRILRSRALVLPSFAEGLPVAIMESLALGRPVITTRITGIPELVQQDANGWLTTAGSVGSLVEAMRDVLQAPSSRLDIMGRRGREKVRQLHYTSTEVDRLEDLLLRYLSPPVEK